MQNKKRSAGGSALKKTGKRTKSSGPRISITKQPGQIKRRTTSKKDQIKNPAEARRGQKKPKGKTKTARAGMKTQKDKNLLMSSDLSWAEEDPKDHLLSRFIYDSNNKVIGESIGVEGRRLIMKSGKKFYSVPLKNIEENEANLTLKGQINRRLARKLGEVWRKKALDPLYQKK